MKAVVDEGDLGGDNLLGCVVDAVLVAELRAVLRQKGLVEVEPCLVVVRHARQQTASPEAVEGDRLDQRAHGFQRPSQLALGLLVDQDPDYPGEDGV